VILNKCLRLKTALSFNVLILMLTFNELLTIVERGIRDTEYTPATASFCRNADTGKLPPNAIKDNH
jgi:hypothetical protein